MLNIRSFPTQNKNLVYSGVGLISEGIIIFSWYDRLSSIIKDKIDEIFIFQLKDNQIKKNARVTKVIEMEQIKWNLYLWKPPLEDGRIAYSVCCTFENYPERLIYSYLRELNKLTLRIERINEINQLKSNELNGIKDFKQDVKELLTQYDDYKKFDEIAKLQNNAQEITDTVRDNIHILLQNKGILEALDTQAEVLEDETGVFLQETIQVKKKFWWKNMKYTFILFSIIALICIILAAYVFNVFFGNQHNLSNYIKNIKNVIKDKSENIDLSI